MSVIVTGLDMPTCCICCPIHDNEFGCCSLIPNSTFYGDGVEYYDPFEEKHKDCPLREYKE